MSQCKRCQVFDLIELQYDQLAASIRVFRSATNAKDRATAIEQIDAMLDEHQREKNEKTQGVLF